MPETSVLDLFPDDTPEYMVQAWVDCLLWAIGEPGILKRFMTETGKSYSVPKSPIEAMIDESTGYKDAAIFAFVPWFNVNIWGKMEGENDFQATDG